MAARPRRGLAKFRGGVRRCQEERRAETHPPTGMRLDLQAMIRLAGLVLGRRPAVVRFEGSDYG